MPNSIYNDLNKGNAAQNNIISRIQQFKNAFSGDPKQIIQGMVNSGRISQAQLNQYAQQADQIYKLMK